mgnify:CR=1 FL=1
MNISHKNLLNNNKRQYHEKIRNIYYYAYNKYQKEYQDKDYRKEVIKWLFSNNEETRMILCSIENKKYTKLINEAYNHYLKDQSVLMHLKDDDDDDKAEFIYKENNKDNSNDYQYQNKIRFFLNEIMFYQCESPINDYSNYSNYFTLNSNIIKNQKSFQEFYEKFNKDTFLQSPIKIKRDEQHKLSYFYFDFPDWLHRKNISDDNNRSPNSNLDLNYSLPEFILALIEQVISIRYIIYKETKDLKEILSNIYLYDLFEKRNKIISYLSQKEKKFSFLYFKIDELVKNLYKDSKLEEFLSNKKESTGFFCSDQYFNIDDDLEKIILDLNIFFNNFLNRNETKDFIDFFMLIHFDKIFTYDDFFFRGVFEKIYDSYAKKVYKDLYFDEEKKVKKKKRKKKKKLKNDNNDNKDKDNDNNNDEENNDENNKNKEKILENDIKSSTLNDTENNKDNSEFIDFGDEILKILSDSNSLNNKNENINSNMNDKNAQDLDYIKKEKNNLNENNQKVDNNNNLINNENIFGQIEDKNNNNKKKIKQKNFFLYETTKNNKKKKKNEHKNNKQNIENNIKNNNDKLNEINTNLILNEIKEKEKEDKGKDKETLNLDIKNINNKNSVNYQKESIELNICNNKEENKHSNINNNNKISIPSHINSITFSSSKPDEIKNNKNVIIFNNNIINIQNNIIFQENIFMLNKKLHNNIIEYNTDLEEALVIQRKIKEEITNYFSSLINELFKDSTLSAYGSSLYKLDIDNSDLDLSISTESNISLSELNDYLLENNDNNKFIKINAILSASVPIIKLEIDYLKMNNDVINELYESLKNTKYYKTYYENKNDNYMNIINIDISLNSANNLQLQFIKDTLIKYPEIKYLIKILKKLLQLKQMNNSYKGGMSSYCLFLLLYSYIKLYFNKDNSNIIINNLDYGSLLTGFLFHYINYVDFNCTIIAPHLINPFVVKGSLDIVPTIIEPTSKKNAGKNIYKIFDVINTFSQIYKDIFFILNNDNTNKNLIYQLLMKYSNT